MGLTAGAATAAQTSATSGQSVSKSSPMDAYAKAKKKKAPKKMGEMKK